ncbi:MAG: hypothetical protein GY749_35860 [Desulfobacteraceae bacterium]|nr:hypothetical protein [Desulfobacteraceae bacterium]
MSIISKKHIFEDFSIKHRGMIFCAILVFIAAAFGQSLGLMIAETTSYNRSTTCMDGVNYYLPAAESFWQFGKPIQKNGEFCVHQPPLYPLILSPWIAGAQASDISVKHVVQIINVICASLAAVGVFFVGRKFASIEMALLAALSYAAYPFLIWLCRDAYSEPLFTMLLVYGILLVFNAKENTSIKKMTAGMMLLGLATLTRGFGLLVPFMLFCGLYLLSHRNKQQLVMWGWGLAVYLMVLAPWCFIASRVSGRLVLVTTSFLPSHVHGLINLPGNTISNLAIPFFNSNPMTFGSVISFHIKALTSETTGYLLFWGQKLINSWYATASGKGQAAVMAINIPLLLLAFYGTGMVMKSERLRPEAMSLLFVSGYFWSMSALVWSVARYMVPAMWIVILFAIVGVHSGLAMLKTAIR